MVNITTYFIENINKTKFNKFYEYDNLLQKLYCKINKYIVLQIIV